MVDYHFTGPRRLCPICKKQVSTTSGKFDDHTVPGLSNVKCAGSHTAIKRSAAKTDSKGEIWGVLD